MRSNRKYTSFCNVQFCLLRNRSEAYGGRSLLCKMATGVKEIIGGVTAFLVGGFVGVAAGAVVRTRNGVWRHYERVVLSKPENHCNKSSLYAGLKHIQQKYSVQHAIWNISVTFCSSSNVVYFEKCKIHVANMHAPEFITVESKKFFLFHVE